MVCHIVTSVNFCPIRPDLNLHYHLSSTTTAGLSTPTDLVVFHHGHTSSCEAFAETARALLSLRPDVTCLLLDCRGAGQSDCPVGAQSYTIDLLVEDTILLVNKLFSASQRFSIAGHSMGGVTALQLAIRHPDRVKKFIAVAPAPATGIRGTATDFLAEERRVRMAARAEGEVLGPVRRRLLSEPLPPRPLAKF